MWAIAALSLVTAPVVGERARVAIPAPAVDAREAARAAAPYTRLPVSARDARLVVDHGSPAWLVTPRGAQSAPRIVVDARTGRVREARDAARGVRATAYATNPARDATTTLFDLPLAPAGPTLAGPRLVARSCVDEGATREVLVAGTPAVIRTCSLLALATPDAAGDFVATPSPGAARDPFAEISLYFHAARALARFDALGGAEVGPAPLDLVASLRVAGGLFEGDLAKAATASLLPFPEALYLPGGAAEGEAFRAIYGVAGGALWFGGTSTRSFAYDADVVTHEMTHAVLDGRLHAGGMRLTESGASAEPDAMNEGLADYFAAAMTGDPVIGEYAAAEAPELVRTLEDPATCADVVGRAHEDGRVLAGALWAARRADPDPEALDRALFRALARGDGRADLRFDELAGIVLAALDPVRQGRLRAELERRGVLAGCSPVVDATPSQSVRAPAATYFAPGTTRFGTDLAPGVVQLRVRVPDGARRLAVRFSAARETPSVFVGRADARFAPIVLASFDAPLRFTRAGDHVASNATAAASATGEGTRAAELPVPDGARVAYVQIANEGEADGAYDIVGFAFPEPAAPPAPSSAALEAGGCGAAPRAPAGGAGRGLEGVALLAVVTAAACSRRRRSRR